MSAVITRASASRAGARPVKGPSTAERTRLKVLAAFKKIGIFSQTRMASVDEGDVISTQTGTFAIVRKESSCRGSMMSVRNLLTRDIKTMKFDPLARLLRLHVEPVQQDKGRRWTITPGDVVLLLADSPEAATALVRHSRAWMPTRAPWLPLSDAEVLLELREGRAAILRNSWRPGSVTMPERLHPGMVVATRNRKEREPSVYIHTAPDVWVSNSRGAELSNKMIRFELGRGTYEVLKLPEIS